MQNAMEEQAAAERHRRAVVTRAEGEKIAAVSKAEGRLEASKRYAKANILLAEASQKAIEKVTIGDKQTPAMYLLGEKYINSIEMISKSENAKIVLLPL